MTRLLTTTAVGLLLGLSPALAETDILADENGTPPAIEDPGLPSEAMPSDAAVPTHEAPGQSSQMAPSHDDAMPELPKATTLDKPKLPEKALEDSASLDKPLFSRKQASDEWLASNLVGQAVVNAENETIGDINDIVTDEDGQVVAVLVGVGGFLGLGEKHVAVRYEDLKFSRGKDQAVRVTTNLTSAMLNSAPDYQRLNEQAITVGENTTDIEKNVGIPSDPGIY